MSKTIDAPCPKESIRRVQNLKTNYKNQKPTTLTPDQSEQAFCDRICEAAAITDVQKRSGWWKPKSVLKQVAKWREKSTSHLTNDEIVARIRAQASQYDTPADGPKAFDETMLSPPRNRVASAKKVSSSSSRRKSVTALLLPGPRLTLIMFV